MAEKKVKKKTTKRTSKKVVKKTPAKTKKVILQANLISLVIRSIAPAKTMSNPCPDIIAMR